jgi:hypothetical protein
MPFSIRPHRRFPVHLLRHLQRRSGQSQATCEISRVQAGVSQETCRCRPGEILSLTVTLPNAQRIKVSEADVRWLRSQELAVEHMAMEPHIHGRVQ